MRTPTAALAADAPGCVQLDRHTVSEAQLAVSLGIKRLSELRKLIKAARPMLAVLGPRPDLDALSGAQFTPAQAAFVTAKAGTKEADSLTTLMAEVFAMLAAGKLVAADTLATKELAEARARETKRRIETLLRRA